MNANREALPFDLNFSSGINDVNNLRKALTSYSKVPCFDCGRLETRAYCFYAWGDPNQPICQLCH
jgi:hypothetical protein